LILPFQPAISHSDNFFLVKIALLDVVMWTLI